MDSLSKFYKYKNDKKIAKEIAKKEKQLESRKLSFQKRQQELIENYKVGLSAKFERKLRSIELRKQRELGSFIRKSLGRKPLKQKMPSMDKIKNKAHSAVQKYAKLSRADKDGYIITVDTMERLKRNDKSVQAGHHRPKKNYPHMAFVVDNIYPIKKWTNKRQADMIGYERKDNLMALIGADVYQLLENRANDKVLKNTLRDHNYYQQMYDKYNTLCLDILHKLDGK